MKGFTNRFIGTHMYINDNRELALRISHDPVLSILKLSDDIAWKTRTFNRLCNYDVFLPQ